MTKLLKNADVTGYISQTLVTSSLLKTDSTGKLVAATAGTDYQSPTTALLPTGGTAGQILSKIDATNYNTQWIDNFATQLKHEVKLGATLAKGKAVYVSSADGTNMIVSAASNASESTSSKTLGLLETGGVTNDIVKVITEGLLAGLDTSTATIGDPVWLGTSGNLLFGLANKPVAPVHMVFIGIVTRVQSNNGEIFVKVQNGFELDELHNVSAVSPSNNDGIFYNTSTSLWEKKSIDAVLGYTAANDANVVHTTGTESIAGTKSFTGFAQFDNGVYLKQGSGLSGIAGYNLIDADAGGIFLCLPNLVKTAYLNISGLTDQRSYTFPDASGTFALTSSLSSYVPTSRTITINGTAYDLSADRSWTVTSMAYPAAGIAVSTGTAWASSIVDNSANWNSAYNNRISTLTTTGSSGAATLTSNTLNIPNYTLSGLGGVPTSRTLTINGTAFDLSSDRSWTVSGTDSTKLPLAGGTLTGNLKILPQAASWAEGLAFSMPTTTTWGGLRWRRERANDDGNWYIGFTALDATDDLVFGANNGGSQVNNILRLTKAGAVSTASSFSSGGLIRVNGNTNLYLDYNYGQSIVGVYSSTKYQGVYSMGDAYKLAIDGSNAGNLYGLAWSHPNAGGQAARLNNHGLLVMINGSTAAAISSNIWASGNINAATDMSATEIRASGWLRTTGSGGVYYEAYGQGIRASKVSTSYGNVETYGENFNGYGGYHIVNNYYTCTMQNTSGTIGWYQQNGNGWLVFWNNGYTCLGVGTDATDPSYSLHIPKYGGSNTGWIIWSDRRIKENIKTIDNALDKVLSLRGVYYNKIDDSKKERQVGYIAQEVMEVVPELVVYSEELDIYNMNYAPMVSLITEAMKEQQAQIDALKEQVQTLLNNINNGI